MSNWFQSVLLLFEIRFERKHSNENNGHNFDDFFSHSVWAQRHKTNLYSMQFLIVIANPLCLLYSMLCSHTHTHTHAHTQGNFYISRINMCSLIFIQIFILHWYTWGRVILKFEGQKLLHYLRYLIWFNFLPNIV